MDWLNHLAVQETFQSLLQHQLKSINSSALSFLYGPTLTSMTTGKNSDAGKDWGQEDNRTTEDEMAGWNHRLNGHEFE